MKALFNGHCGRCDKFKPRCAVIRVQARNMPPEVRPRGSLSREWVRFILCEDCRKAMRGKYRLGRAAQGD